jgi:hypothetical protein
MKKTAKILAVALVISALAASAFAIEEPCEDTNPLARSVFADIEPIMGEIDIVPIMEEIDIEPISEEIDIEPVSGEINPPAGVVLGIGAVLASAGVALVCRKRK